MTAAPNALPDDDPDRIAKDILEKASSPRRRLEDILEELILRDPEINEALRTEALGPADVMTQARIILNEETFDSIAKLQEVERAEAERDTLLRKANAWYVNAAAAAVALSFFILLGLLGIYIAKWTNHITTLPIWPFTVSSAALASIGLPILARIELRDDPDSRKSATISAESLRRGLNDMLRSLVIKPAIDRATSLDLTPPLIDAVYLTDAPGLSSRIESGRRIETQAYRDVVTNLARDGGATIGLAGSRGVGKSELLRAFCDDPNKAPSIETGGVIGISIPAPVAYESQPFLRVLIRRLAAAVPGYDEKLVSRPAPSLGLSLAGLIFSAALLIAGVGMLRNFSKHEAGWALVCAGALGVVILAIRLTPKSYTIPAIKMALEFAELALLPFLREVLSIARSALSAPLDLAEIELRGNQINQKARQGLAIKAVEVARRVRYVETRSASLESSASWHDSGFKHTAGFSLDQVPLTEPDLVLELADLVTALHGGGYQVRIGIDELDKLAHSDDAAAFLTGIKALFTIRDCSFILTISENAFSQFARRGMPIRDVFDSSLDSVAIVQPLMFEEARRLIRARLSTDYSDKVSDTQVLLCYCLAGGLPRELLRFCRQLGEINSKIEGPATLAQVMDLLFRAEISSRIDGIRFALQDRQEKDAATTFIAQLELIEMRAGAEKTLDLLNSFLSDDPSFAAVSVEGAQASSQEQLPQTDGKEWVQDSRRQIFAYLYFVDTVRSALELLDLSGSVTGDSAKDLVGRYEGLADARRRLEMDAAAGWRCVSGVRSAFGLAEIPAIKRASESRGLVEEVARTFRRTLRALSKADGSP
jgi:hypothetical protein